MKQKNKKLIQNIFTAVGVLLVAAGIFVVMLPKITNYIYDKNVDRQVTQFEADTADNSLDRLYAELQKRNKELYENKQNGLVDPFSYSQPDIDLSAYGLKNNTIGFLYIPAMELNIPILLGANEGNMAQGAAHLTNTSYPIGGTNTNAVLAAHRGFSKAKMFRHIEVLKKGDKVYIKNFRETLTYEVFDTEVITPTEVDKLKIRDGEDMVTLITCHPYRHNYQRYLVFCRRV